MKIKELRNSRCWSQDEMAIGCGIGLRTVQRLESSGSCSMETLKAIAVAFDTDVHLLLATEVADIDYINVQLGYTILGALFTVFAVCVWQFSRGNFPVDAFVVTAPLLALVCTLFGSLTVKVKDGFLIWYFGVGFWKKKVDLTCINTVEKVRNKGWWGWGIRYYGAGWLYNVSGLRAVEVALDSGERFRVGTDEPESLLKSLQRNLG